MEYLESLRIGNSLGRGEFVLDEAEARKKLRDFQLPSPHHYLLEFVRAAHLLGAMRVEFAIDVDEVTLVFDGEALTSRDLGVLYSAPFAQERDHRQRALRHLAIGANSARGLGLWEFRIQVSGDEPQGVCIIGDEIEPLEVDLDEDVAWTTRIYLRRRPRLSHLARFVDSLRGTLGEVQLLEEHCRFSNSIVRVNGEVVSGGFRLPDSALMPVDFEGPTEKGRLGITMGDRRLVAHILHHGVLIRSGEWPAEVWGAEAVVDSSRLTTNLSQSAFVEDDAWQELREILDEATLRSFTTYVETLAAGEWKRNEEFVRLGNTLVDVLAGIDGRNAFDARIERFLDAVESLPLFVIGDGLRLSFSSSLGQIRLLKDELDRIHGIRNRVRRWKKTPAVVAPEAARYEHQKVRDLKEGWQICCALGAEVEESEVLFIKDGRLLARQVLETEVKGVRLALGGDLPVTPSFDGPESSGAIKEALIALVNLFVEVVDEALPQMSRQWRFAYLRERLSGRLRSELALAFGWSSSEDVPMESLREVESHQPENFFAQMRRTPLFSRVAKLGSLGRMELFADARGDRFWSLREIQQHCLIENLEVLPVVGPDGQEWLDDERLGGHPLLVEDAEFLEIIYSVLEILLVPVAKFLEMIDDDETDAVDGESSGPSLMSITDFLRERDGEEESQESTVGLMRRKLGFLESADQADWKPVSVPALEESPEERFLSKLRQKLRKYQSALLITPGQIFKLRLVAEDLQGVACLHEDRLLIDRTHPVVEHALERPEDPVALAFVALAIHGELPNDGEIRRFGMERREFLSRLVDSTRIYR